MREGNCKRKEVREVLKQDNIKERDHTTSVTAKRHVGHTRLSQTILCDLCMWLARCVSSGVTNRVDKVVLVAQP